MNTLRLDILDVEPRSFKGKTSYSELSSEEREAFVEKRITAIKDSTASKTAKQAALLRSGAFGIATAAAFDQYVERKDDWFL